jgi:hypothetical protein
MLLFNCAEYSNHATARIFFIEGINDHITCYESDDINGHDITPLLSTILATFYVLFLFSIDILTAWCIPGRERRHITAFISLSGTYFTQ